MVDKQEIETEDLDTLTSLPASHVICTGNLGKVPGNVVTDIPAHGETMKAQSQDITETSLVKQKWKLLIERMTNLTR